jgi:anti-anti-sigma factor
MNDDTVEPRDGPAVAVVALRGEVDIATIEPARAEVDVRIAGGATRIVFDLSAVSFLDSIALALFAQTRRRGVDVTIRHPSRLTRRVIELTGLSDVVTVEP